MTVCSRCKTENPESNRFCDFCGAPLARACAACGHANRPDSRFCGNCGTLLDGGERAAPAALPGLTPQHLALRIRDARHLLEGERKQVTIMFADIRGSTELIQKLDPELALQRLDPGLKAMIDGVHRYEGTVGRVQGDGIMALFGAPIAHEDHAVRACLSAKAMLEAVAALGSESMQIRVGLNSGEVVVRSIGNDLSMDYDAVGATVHLAHRMEQLAEPGTALLTRQTARLAMGFAETRSRGTVTLKGIAEPVEIFELVAVVGLSRWEARAAVLGLTGFVGRERETAALAGALRRAAAGRGQIVAIVGEAGIGKSRLVHEFLQPGRTEGWTVLRTAATPHDRSTPHLVIADLLQSWVGAEPQDGKAEIDAKLRRKLAGLDAAAAPSLAPLQFLLHVAVEDAGWEGLDPGQRRERIRETVKRLLLALAAEQPLILLVEDLHWADEESQAVLDALADALGAVRLLLLATYRPEYRHNWADRSYYSQLPLDPLEADAADALLRQHLGEGDELAPLRRRLIERTEGTPLFLEESVRTLVETGVLVQEQSPFRLTRRVEEIEIPETVQSVLAARIDRLPAAHRRLLQIASVIGRDVPLSLLQEVAAMPSAEMARQLAELQAFEFLYEVSLPSGTEYTFKHALTHEVAYEGMLLKHRRALHASVLAAIEAGHAGRLDALTERLAEHAWKGEVWDKAADYYYKAGQRANERSAHGVAIDFLESALDALSRLPKESATIARGVDIRLGLRVALGAAADFVRMRHCLQEAEELATAIGDQQKLALITISRSTILSNLGALDEAIAAGERARRIAGETGEWASRINAAFALGQAYWFAGALQSAAAVLEAEEAALKTVWRRRSSGTTGTASVLCLGCLANTYSLQGDFTRALACSAEAVTIATELERPYDLSYAHIASGLALLTRGEVDSALEHLETALDHARAGAIPLLVPSTARYLGRAYAEAGRPAEARALLTDAVEHARANTLVGLDAWCSASLALALLGEGTHGEAAATARGALDVAGRYGYRPIEVYAMRLLGKIEATAPAGDAAAAARHYRDAIALGASLGMRPETAHCQQELAGVLERLGESAAALAAAQAAADLYRACGMERRHQA